MSAISTTMQNFIQIGLGVSVLRMRDFAPLKWAQSDSAIFLVLEKGYSRDTCTDFDAKYVKRRGSAQGSAFFGSWNPHFPQKPPLLVPFRRDLAFLSPENGFNIGRLESKRPLIVVVAQ